MASSSSNGGVLGKNVQSSTAEGVAGAPPWDPLSSPDWSGEKHSIDALVRIKRDLQSLYTDPPPGICVVPEGDDITQLHVLITGPFDTPYEGGFFHFKLRFPPNYPLVSPRMRFMTTCGGTVRFNPNLYPNGKVCLSILGTWAGPSWTAAQSLLSLLLSVQSLMNEKPYHNEPGYEEEHSRGDVVHYNNIVCHETLRVGVCEALERNSCPAQLLQVMRSSFLEFYEYYTGTARQLAAKLEGQHMIDPFSFNKGLFNFRNILKRLESLHACIAKELDS